MLTMIHCFAGEVFDMVFHRQWEEFPVGPGTGNASSDLRVTLNRKGEIMIGAKAFNMLGEPENAVLLFDRRNETIGVAPVDGDATNAYPLIAKKDARHRLLRANLFCRHHKIFVPRTAAFGKVEIDADGILVLDLRTLVGVGGKPKP